MMSDVSMSVCFICSGVIFGASINDRASVL
jgi:hypothetical protein